ncbi:MAG TPA: diacylglycerol kinase family protein [Pantanalinema sp.]
MRFKAHSLVASFKYALAGLYFMLRTQRNMRIHTLSGVLAFCLAVALRLPRLELAIIAMVCSLVVVCEMFNTAIENAVDLATHKRHPLAKAAKDVAAAAVLASALNAVLVGGLLLLPPLLRALSLR